MKQTRRSKPSSAEYLEEGRQAFIAGRFYLAAEAFEKAYKLDGRNPVVLFNLANARERLGEIDEAAALHTQALRVRPAWDEPARRLALLLGRFQVETASMNPHGLLAAFAFPHIDQQSVAKAALDYLRAHSAIGEAVAQASDGNPIEAARALILRRTDKVLSDPLLLVALTSSPNRNPDIELLLTALRRVIAVEIPEERFGDKALTGFVIALIQQCMLNEYVFAVGDEETSRLADLSVDFAALLDGNAVEARSLMISLLYRSPSDVVGKKLSLSETRSIRPRALGDLLMRWSADEDRRTVLAANIPVLGAIEDETTRRVAEQYEAHPYPRWDSLQMPAEGCAADMLKRYFPVEQLAFMEKPYRVLIAGCGTGQQALAAARRYGPNADILAVDLSCASLAYAQAKAEAFELTNLRFAQADLQSMGQGVGPFDIVEAIGVLHHMAEPFKGWQALVDLLRPGGFILTGLYSAVARGNIATLRSETDYPGAGCSDDEARAYRRRLLVRDDEEAAILRLSHDFYTLSEFRDLVLHEHERPVVLSEIGAFMERSGLTFKGFQLPVPVLKAFTDHFPESPWPGRLSDWASFEEEHTHLFDGMYRFWCEKG